MVRCPGFVFFGEWVMRWMILSICLFTRSGVFVFFVAGIVIKAVGPFPTHRKISIGLPCDDSEIKFMTLIDLFAWSLIVSSWILGD